ncbi:MAG: cation:proton antiporter [Bacteroidales bacterium]|nr:cation:proton antiporter [Bacteroidales bacterium]
MTLLAFNLNPENLALLGSALIIVAILVNKVGARVGLPFLLLALIVGVVAGPDVIGIHFDNYENAKSIGHLAMTIILFTAGFETSFPKIKPIFWQGVVLSTVGVILTVLITGLFIYFVLGRPSMMLHSIVPALCIGLFIMLVARPAGVLLSMLPFRNFSFKARLFTSWVGLKGAGPILFAIYPIVAHIGGGVELFNIVFVITLMSLLIQGTTLRPFARLLRLSYDEDPVTETFGMEIPDEMGMLRDHTVSEEDLAGGNTLRDLHLPHGIRVMMVRRGGKFLMPHGSMTLVPGDKLIIIMGDSDD